MAHCTYYVQAAPAKGNVMTLYSSSKAPGKGPSVVVLAARHRSCLQLHRATDLARPTRPSHFQCQRLAQYEHNCVTRRSAICKIKKKKPMKFAGWRRQLPQPQHSFSATGSCHVLLLLLFGQHALLALLKGRHTTCTHTAASLLLVRSAILANPATRRGLFRRATCVPPG